MNHQIESIEQPTDTEQSDTKQPTAKQHPAAKFLRLRAQWWLTPEWPSQVNLMPVDELTNCYDIENEFGGTIYATFLSSEHHATFSLLVREALLTA